MAEPPRNRFKTAEGRFTLHSERTSGLAFNYQRATRLTLATLQGGAEDGAWIVYNAGDLIHIARFDATHREPHRSLQFNTNSPTRSGWPTCHAHAPAKDGVDLLVGLGDGQVMLMSLRANLQASGAPAKPVAVCTLSPEGAAAADSTARCTAVAWVPRSDGGQFVVASSSGNIYTYKKSALTGSGEGGSGGGKFSLSIGSSSKTSQSPSATIPISGGGINDIAISPDARQLAAACRDGALRVVDLATGTVVGGFTSYYGALLCCAFSPDGKYVATGGEDDLVAVYGLAERFPVMHGEGHRSWVSRVAFDPWALTDTGGASSALSELAPNVRLYRVGSAGQDAQLCLWDVQIPTDGDFNAAALLATMQQASVGGIKRNGGGGGTPPSSASRGPAGSADSTTHHNSGSMTTSVFHDRKASLGNSRGICPPLPRLDMYIVQPIMEHRLHVEPMSDVLFTEAAIYTADHSGCIKVWLRPKPGDEAAAADP